jgi:hypothetical protein
LIQDWKKETSGGIQVEQTQSGIGSGALVLSFITGLAAGIAAALLIDKTRDKSLGAEDYEDELFI